MALAGRKDWIQADMRCLMCGRVLGRLVGPLPAEDATRRVAGRPPQFAAFRPADASVAAVRLGSQQPRFRCTTCGGALIMDEVETFSTYDDIDEEAEQRPRRGRPPKPWRRQTSEPNWMDELGIAG